MTPLTPRQRDIFNWIAQYIVDYEFPPSVREIAHAFGIRSPNGVMRQLKALRAKGWINWAEREARTITITPEAKVEIGMAGPHFISHVAVA